MTLKELYQNIGGDYEKAIKILMMDKLLDKHIRKLPNNGVVDNLIAAGDTMDPTTLFETSHAVKGVCANLGLTEISDAASEISEEFRPGNERHLSDEQVREKLDHIAKVYSKIKEGIRTYEEA